MTSVTGNGPAVEGQDAAARLPLLDRLPLWVREGPRGPLALGVAGFTTSLLGLLLSDENRIGQWGLVMALNPLVPLGLVAILVAFAWSLTVTGATSRLWLLLVAFMVGVLHGAPAVIESEPRFPVAWLHSGFVDYIARNGELLPNVDARFSWPGFFTSAATFTQATGIDQTTSMRWVPVLAELVIAVSIFGLARAFGVTERQAAIAAWLYIVWDWVGQTYYAPQTMAVIMALAVLTLALERLPRAKRAFDHVRLGRFRLEFAQLPPTGIPGNLSWAASLAILVLTFGLSMSHQLTPVVITALIAVLAIIGRVRPALLPWLVGLIVVGWLCYAARPYWIGHLADIYGGLGHVGTNLERGTTARIGGSSVRVQTLVVRAGFSVGLFAIAAFGLWRRWRATGKVELLIVAMCVVPVLLVGAQAYGGEIMLRVFLFALPALALLATFAFTPLGAITRTGAAAMMVVTLFALPAFGLARYGNEEFERVLPGEVTAVDQLYRIASKGASISVVVTSLPWRFRDYELYDYRSVDVNAVADLDPAEISHDLPDNPNGAYLVLNQSQFAQMREFYGLDANIQQELTTLLNKQPWLEKVYSNDVSMIYKVIPNVTRPTPEG